MRALEIVMITEKVVKPLHLVVSPLSKYDALWIGIKVPKEEIDRRIEKRLDQWFDAGLIDETKKLKNPERFALAYTAIAKYLKGDSTEAEMRAEALRSIRAYAKRQMTWFKRNKKIQWINPLDPPYAKGEGVEKLIKEWLQA